MSIQFANKKARYLSVTPLAASKIAGLAGSLAENYGIRITLKTKGCNGLEYDIQYATPQNVLKTDDLIEVETGQNAKINVFIDSKFSLYIIGTTLDYQESDTESGFKFINPNEAGRCGCGTSFTV
jgi:iron-sulfur cluster assembly protein